MGDELHKTVADIVKSEVGQVVADLIEERTTKAQEEARNKTPEFLGSKQFPVDSSNKPVHEMDANEKSLLAARCVRYMVASGSVDGAIDMAKRYGDKNIVEAWERTKALNTDSFAAGGALLPTEFSSSVIELLSAKTVVRALGATVIPMNTGSLTMPFIDTGSTAAYVGAQGDNIVSSQPTFGQLNLSDKKLAALTPIGNDLLRNGGVAADRIIRDDIVRAMSLKEDITFVRSDGTLGEPKGLLYWAQTKFDANATTSVANVTQDLSRAPRELEDLNVPLDRMGWIMTPREKYGLMAARDGNNNLVWADEMSRGTLLGFPYRVTTQIPTNLGSGDKSEVYLANFASVVLAENESMMIEAFQGAAYHDGSAVQSAVSRDETVIRGIALHDFGCRQRGKEVVVIEAVKWDNIT